MRKDAIRLILNKNALAKIVGEDFMIELSDSLRKEVIKLAERELVTIAEGIFNKKLDELSDVANYNASNSELMKFVMMIKKQAEERMDYKIRTILKQEVESTEKGYPDHNAVNELKKYWDEQKSKILDYINNDIQNHVDTMVKKSFSKILGV